MPSTTRSSARNASKDASPVPSVASSAAGGKRKGGAATGASPPRKASKQATMEEVGVTKQDPPADEQPAKDEPPEDEQDATKAEDTSEAAPSESKPSENGAAKGDPAPGVRRSPARGAAVPSTVLEKGLFYVFARPRVAVDSPDSAQDLARTYLVLRPLPTDAGLSKTGGAAAGEREPRFRVLALPKKVLPGSGRDRFMVFVDGARMSAADVRGKVLGSREYETATLGRRHEQAAAPVGEGVYALVHSEATSHFAYVTTLPSPLGAVQHDLNLRERGSFVLSLKNPERKGPANAQLDKPAEFSQEIKDEFRGRAWMPLKAEHWEYVNAQALLIGEGVGQLGKAGEGKGEGEGEKEEPGEEVERLEAEDEKRVEHLQGDDAIFEDLNLDSKEFPRLRTTWD